MHRSRFLPVMMLAALSGCGGVRVSVDARLIGDSSQWHHLDGPTYRIVGVTPESESSLEFQEYADLLAAALREPRPNLRRLAGGGAAAAGMKPAQGAPQRAAGFSPRGPSNTQGVAFSATHPAVPVRPDAAATDASPETLPRPDIVLTFSFHVFDRGTAVESYPLFAHHRRDVYGPYGHVHSYYSPIYAGQAVETVHLGFVHSASLSAWIWDPAQSTGRRVIWEGRARLTAGNPDLRAAMPYLAVALASTYGQPTQEGPALLKFKPDDDRLQSLRGEP